MTGIALEAFSTTSRATIVIRFASEAQAVNYLTSNPWEPGQSFYVVGEVEGEEIDFDLYPVLYDTLHPTCEHGLSERLCAGPNHYPLDHQIGF